jgi:hypothetical protein
MCSVSQITSSLTTGMTGKKLIGNEEEETVAYAEL